MSNRSQQILFWAVIFVFLNLLFGSRWDNYLDSFYFTTMLMPVAIGTSYFFNDFLVPKYLDRKQHIRFALYTIYAIIVSLFLSAVISMFAFVILADLKWRTMNPIVGDIYQMGMIIYFVAVLFSFIRLYQSNLGHKEQITELEQAQEKNLQKVLTVRSNRKSVPISLEHIFYIESLADYVKIHTTSEVIITKEKISQLEQKLPNWFIRIHRSFLINQHKVESFAHDHIQIQSQQLPLGRKYKKEAVGRLNTNNP
ncbi:MAG: DNA-binding protein [Roseivirga sp.]|nr:DNA-binding protein [Roseivirga sp.]